MEIKEKLNKLCNLLELSSDVAYSQSCLEEILEGEVSFFPGTELETQHAYETYAHRYQLQNDVLEKKKVKGYEYVLDKLRLEKDKTILYLTISSKKASYMLFTTINFERLIGILYSEVGELERAKDLKKLYQARGLGASSSLFYKGDPYLG